MDACITRIRVNFHCRVIFLRAYARKIYMRKVEAMHGRPSVNAKVEGGSTFTWTRDLHTLPLLYFGAQILINDYATG